MVENDAVLGCIEQRLRGLEVPLAITLWNGRRLAAAEAARVSVAFPATREYIYAG